MGAKVIQALGKCVVENAKSSFSLSPVSNVAVFSYRSEFSNLDVRRNYIVLKSLCVEIPRCNG